MPFNAAPESRLCRNGKQSKFSFMQIEMSRLTKEVLEQYPTPGVN